VSSGAHLGGKINFDDLHLTRKYSSWGSYAQSKLANVLFTYELARRLEGTGITVNCLHPGFVRTRFAWDRKTEKPHPMIRMSSLFTIPPEKGAETSVYLASSPEVDGVTGKYFVRMKPVSSSRKSYDLETARKFWEVSAKLTKLDGETV
jgi:NAD(P)-dependent dehydrogenase (short-subunit alcohol dehydrogenase family)